MDIIVLVVIFLKDQQHPIKCIYNNKWFLFLFSTGDNLIIVYWSSVVMKYYCTVLFRVFWEGLEIGLRLHSSEFYSHPNPNRTTYHNPPPKSYLSKY